MSTNHSPIQIWCNADADLKTTTEQKYHKPVMSQIWVWHDATTIHTGLKTIYKKCYSAKIIILTIHESHLSLIQCILNSYWPENDLQKKLQKPIALEHLYFLRTLVLSRQYNHALCIHYLLFVSHETPFGNWMSQIKWYGAIKGAEKDFVIF